MKIGLLLGSFDPPHSGHKYAALYALKHGMDKVLVIPAWKNPWKNKQTSYSLRCQMCMSEFQNYSDIIVSDIEKFTKSQYTYQTLTKILKHNSKHEYYIIGGTDIIPQIPKWKQGSWILKNFKVLEVPRPGFGKTVEGLGCSSSYIRELIKNKIAPMFYINLKTLNIITDNKLYDI